MLECRETTGWRRGWDSNPRDGFPPTRVPGVRLQPLGHLSSPRRCTVAPDRLRGCLIDRSGMGASRAVVMPPIPAGVRLLKQPGGHRREGAAARRKTPLVQPAARRNAEREPVLRAHPRTQGDRRLGQRLQHRTHSFGARLPNASGGKPLAHSPSRPLRIASAR